MGQVLPFTPFQVFDPATADVMGRAFDAAWQRIRDAAVDPVSAAWEEQTKETLAAHIIAMAQSGERDVTLLRDRAIVLFGEGRPPPAEADAAPLPIEKTFLEQQQPRPPAAT